MIIEIKYLLITVSNSTTAIVMTTRIGSNTHLKAVVSRLDCFVLLEFPFLISVNSTPLHSFCLNQKIILFNGYVCPQEMEKRDFLIWSLKPIQDRNEHCFNNVPPQLLFRFT